MALKCEIASPPDGIVVNQESGGDDLEDGEIFDEDDDTPTIPTAPAPQPAPLVEEKRKSSPARKTSLARQKRPKRLREDDRLFRNSKQRRKSDESEKSKEKGNLTEDEEMQDMSPLRGSSQEWDRGGHHRTNFPDDFMDDEEEEDELGNRRGRGFGNRSRRGRNGGRGGGSRRGGITRRDNSQICRFFIIGKCQKGNDCQYSHAQQRKFEVCKFYMMDCCAKKDRCLFMHSEFPCKFYYLGMKCFGGKKCKYFHGKLSSQLKANLIRDSKECDFLQHPQDSSPKEDRQNRRDRERDRNREHRSDREYKEKDRERDRDKERERREEKDRDKYTLHFKVDPRTISDEEEGNRTPMPSPPSQDNSSDRGSKSPELAVKKKNSPKADHPLQSEQKDNKTEEIPNFIPGELDKHQRELYRRIQQRREAPAAKAEEEEVEKETDDYKEVDWYSSEEDEEVKNPLHTILKTLKQTPATRPMSPPKTSSASMPAALPMFSEIDINAVSKLLSTVRETIQQKQQSDSSHNNPMVPANASPAVPNTVLPPGLTTLPPLSSLISDTLPPLEKSRRRDPRIKSNSTEDDIDLRIGPKGDVDLRQLPFKPAPVHTPANEIHASITSHPPVEYRVIRIPSPLPPNYSSVPSKNVKDPRLQKIPGAISSILTPMVSMPLPPVVHDPIPKSISSVIESHRDPRQRGLLANDPRRKSSLLLQRDSDLRQAPPAFNTINDIDLRLHPAAAAHLAFK